MAAFNEKYTRIRRDRGISIRAKFARARNNSREIDDDPRTVPRGHVKGNSVSGIYRATPGIDRRRRRRRDEFSSCRIVSSTAENQQNIPDRIISTRSLTENDGALVYIYIYVYTNFVSFFHLSFHFFLPLSTIFPRRLRETFTNIVLYLRKWQTRTLLPLISPIHIHKYA